MLQKQKHVKIFDCFCLLFLIWAGWISVWFGHEKQFFFWWGFAFKRWVEAVASTLQNSQSKKKLATVDELSAGSCKWSPWAGPSEPLWHCVPLLWAQYLGCSSPCCWCSLQQGWQGCCGQCWWWSVLRVCRTGVPAAQEANLFLVWLSSWHSVFNDPCDLASSVWGPICELIYWAALLCGFWIGISATAEWVETFGS